MCLSPWCPTADRSAPDDEGAPAEAEADVAVDEALAVEAAERSSSEEAVEVPTATVEAEADAAEETPAVEATARDVTEPVDAATTATEPAAVGEWFVIGRCCCRSLSYEVVDVCGVDICSFSPLHPSPRTRHRA